MESIDVRKSVAGIAVAASLGLSAASADAVVYSSRFDPPTFEGTATFDVDQACLDAGPGTVDPYAAGCSVTWLTAEITLKDGSIEYTFDYSHVLPDSSVIEDIYVENGELVGVNSAPIGPRIVTSFDTSHTPFHGPWWIEYIFTPPSFFTFAALDVTLASIENFGQVVLYTGECFSEGDAIFCSPNLDEPVDFAVVENFTRVAQIPEPGTLALALGALGGAWLARRRKATAAR